MSDSKTMCTPDYKVNIIDVPEVDSTNAYIMAHAEELPDFTFFSAQKQTAGKGRVGRCWVSPDCDNLYATFLLKSWPFPAYQATWLASLALQSVFKEMTPHVATWIKWPNDILVRNQKLVGILAESKVLKSGTSIIALGMGVNLNLSKTEAEKITPPPTSLRIECENARIFPQNSESYKINRKIFAEKLVFSLMRVYFKASSFGVDTIFQEWRHQNALIGRTVSFALPNGKSTKGVVRDVTFEGDILIENGDGVQAYQCGDIHLDKSSLI